MTYSHLAVGTIGEPLDLRVSIEWTPGETGIRIILKELGSLIELGAYVGQTAAPMPDGTLSDATLDAIVWRGLSPFRVVTASWVTDPVSLAAEYSAEWGWKWVPEKLAQ